MKKLTSLIMSLLIVLQAGVFIRAEEQNNDPIIYENPSLKSSSQVLTKKISTPRKILLGGYIAGMVVSLAGFIYSISPSENKKVKPSDKNDIVKKALAEENKTSLIYLSDEKLINVGGELEKIISENSGKSDPLVQLKVFKAKEQLRKVNAEASRRYAATGYGFYESPDYIAACAKDDENRNNDVIGKTLEEENKTNLSDLPDEKLATMEGELEKKINKSSGKSDPFSQEQLAKLNEQLRKVNEEAARRHESTSHGPAINPNYMAFAEDKVNEEAARRHESTSHGPAINPNYMAFAEDYENSKASSTSSVDRRDSSEKFDTNKDLKTTTTDQTDNPKPSNPNLIDLATTPIKEIVVSTDVNVKVNNKTYKDVTIRYEKDKDMLDKYQCYSLSKYIVYGDSGNGKLEIVAKISFSEHTFDRGRSFHKIKENIKFYNKYEGTLYNSRLISSSSTGDLRVNPKEPYVYDRTHSIPDQDNLIPYDLCIYLLQPLPEIIAYNVQDQNRVNCFLDWYNQNLNPKDSKKSESPRIIRTYKDLKEALALFDLDIIIDTPIMDDSPIPKTVNVSFSRVKNGKITFKVEENLQKILKLKSSYISNSNFDLIRELICYKGLLPNIFFEVNQNESPGSWDYADLAIKTQEGAIILLNFVEGRDYRSFRKFNYEDGRKIFNSSEPATVVIKDILLVSKSDSIFNSISVTSSLESCDAVYIEDKYDKVTTPFSGTIWELLNRKLNKPFGDHCIPIFFEDLNRINMHKIPVRFIKLKSKYMLDKLGYEKEPTAEHCIHGLRFKSKPESLIPSDPDESYVFIDLNNV